MKVLLINPPALNTILGNNPTLIEEERGLNPPIGLLYVAGSLRDYEVRMLDAQDGDYQLVRREVEEFSPDVVGITTMTFTLVDVVETVRAVRSVSPECRIVLGGIHTYLYPKETLELRGVDYIVLGEGERSFSLLLEVLSKGRKPEAIPGIGYREYGEIRITPPESLDDLDSVPFPARELLPVDRYYSVLSRRNPVTIMVTSRGCPYRCIFCNRPHLGKRWRARSADSVVEEMELCRELGVGEILFYDDTFNISRGRVLEICNGILERGVEIGWDVRARVDLVDEEMLEKLKSAGCQRIHFGVEASSDKSLRILRKGYTVDDVRRAFSLTRKVGLESLAYFMIGIPGEGRKEAKRTIEFMCSLDADYAHITVLTPFPGTELYQMGLENGILGSDHWREFARNPTAEFRPPYWEEGLCREELEELVAEAYWRFYIRPRYIMRQLGRTGSLAEFLRKARAGLRVLGMRRGDENR